MPIIIESFNDIHRQFHRYFSLPNNRLTDRQTAAIT